MSKIEPYVKRPVYFVKYVSSYGWRLKIYEISAYSKRISEELVNNAIKELIVQLPQPPNLDTRYGVGFLIIHQGTMRNWFLLDWWEHEDILCQKLFSSPLEESNSITRENESSIVACIHELRVIHFESNAWINAFLSKDRAPDLEKYMAQTINEVE